MADVTVNSGRHSDDTRINSMNKEVVRKRDSISHCVSSTYKHETRKLKLRKDSCRSLLLLVTSETVDTSTEEVISSKIPVSSELFSSELSILLVHNAVDTVEETKELDT